MAKNLRLYYILTFVLVSIALAWKSLAANFGVGVNFVVMLVLLAIMLMLICADRETRSRTMDLFVVSCVFTGFELISFLVLEIFNNDITLGTIRGFNVYQSVISFLALVYFAYIVFRLACEMLGKKIVFVEILLGNIKRERKHKKAKELTNGSLMEKPNKHKELEETSNFLSVQQTESPLEERAAEGFVAQAEENAEEQTAQSDGGQFGLSTNVANTSLVLKNDEESEN